MEARSLQSSAADRRRKSIKELAIRHERSIQLANQWLDSNKTTQEELAALLKADRTALNRYLNGQDGYEPCSTRPQMMKILEGLERVCSSPYDIVEIRPQSVGGGLGWEDGALYNYHLQLNHSYRRGHEPSALPSVCAPLVSMAVHGPAEFRSRMCANTLVTLAAALERIEPGVVSERALHDAAAWAERLEQAGLEAIGRCPNPLVKDRLINGAGGVIGQCGALVGDEARIDAGMRRLIDSARRSQEEDDGFWTDTLALVERLFVVNASNAARWSAEAAKAAQAHPSDSLWFTLRTRRLPAVWTHWNRLAPDLLISRERKDA